MDLYQHTKFQADWPHLCSGVVVFKNSAIWLTNSSTTIFQIIFYFLPTFMRMQKVMLWLTQLLLRYCWFIYPEILMTENIFGLTQLKIHKPSFKYFESLTPYQKSRWLINFFLRYGWFMNRAIWLAASIFNYIQLKTYKPSFEFL